jgi:bla regulator protein BlaR1
MIPSAFAPIVAHLWQSTLFAAVAALLTLALQRNRARVRYWLWLAASYKFLIPFSWLVSVGHLFQWRAVPAILSSIVLTNLSAASPVFDPPLALLLLIWAVWTCGFLAVAAGWAREWSRMRAIARTASPVPLGLPIPVLSTAVPLEPGVFGIFRQVLLLPDGIAIRLTQVQLRAVLAHELCHVRRRDNLTAAFHMLVEAVFWFHPLVWWLGLRMVDERERACDEEVLQAGSEAHVYAETILKVCEFYLESPLTCMSGITGSDLKKRMERIMRNRVGENLKIRKKLLLATAGIAALALPVVVGVMTASRLRAQSLLTAATRPVSDIASVTLTASEGPVTSEPQSQVYQAGENGVSYATCAYCPNPKYSNQALKAHYEGAVTLQAVITAQGRATKIKVVKSPGLGLDREAVDVVKRWKFKPAVGPNGNPVDVEVPIEVTFRLPTKKDSREGSF